MSTVTLRERALERAAAQSKSGPTFGKDECLIRVRKLYGADAIGDFDGDGSADAEDGWKATKHRHPAPLQLDAIPAGVPLWWGGGSADHGHVAISAGRGMCWSTDIRRTGRFDLVPIAEITREWGLPFLGWTEDINGVRVYDPPPSTSKEKPVPAPNHVQKFHLEAAAALTSLDRAISEFKAADADRTAVKGQIPGYAEDRARIAGRKAKVPAA